MENVVTRESMGATLRTVVCRRTGVSATQLRRRRAPFAGRGEPAQRRREPGVSRHAIVPSVRAMSTDQRHALGFRGETLAAVHLERLGYAIVARNHRTRWGELDVVAHGHDVLVFCEVKSRRQGSGSPFDAFRGPKQHQVRRMAAAYLVEAVDRPTASEVRFDAIGVVLDAHGALVSLDHLEGAF